MDNVAELRKDAKSRIIAIKQSIPVWISQDAVMAHTEIVTCGLWFRRIVVRIVMQPPCQSAAIGKGIIR